MTKAISLPILMTVLLLATSIHSCKYSDHNKTYTYMHEWTIDYPSFFRKSQHVYPGSEFQISNGYRDTYAFAREVITHLTQDSLIDSLKTRLIHTLEDPKIERDSSYQLNNASFRSLEITGLLNDKRMYYILSVIKSDNTLYQFTGWMFNHKRDLWEEDYKAMLHSWKRIGPSK